MIAPHERLATGAAAAFAGRVQSVLPRLETDRLRLRPPRIEDFEAYAEIALSPRGRYLTEDQTRDAAWYDFCQMTATWVLRGQGLWTVEDRDAGQCLGFVLLGFEPGDNEPELGYLFLPAAEGQGYAREAAEAARRYGFTVLDLPTLVSTIDPTNTRSRRLAERMGAVRDPKAESAYDGAILVYRHPKPEAA